MVFISAFQQHVVTYFMHMALERANFNKVLFSNYDCDRLSWMCLNDFFSAFLDSNFNCNFVFFTVILFVSGGVFPPQLPNFVWILTDTNTPLQLKR